MDASFRSSRPIKALYLRRLKLAVGTSGLGSKSMLAALVEVDAVRLPDAALDKLSGALGVPYEVLRLMEFLQKKSSDSAVPERLLSSVPVGVNLAKVWPGLMIDIFAALAPHIGKQVSKTIDGTVQSIQAWIAHEDHALAVQQARLAVTAAGALGSKIKDSIAQKRPAEEIAFLVQIQALTEAIALVPELRLPDVLVTYAAMALGGSQEDFWPWLSARLMHKLSSTQVTTPAL